MCNSSIHLVGLEDCSDAVLYSTTMHHDQPEYQTIRVMSFIQNPSNLKRPKVILGRIETIDSELGPDLDSNSGFISKDATTVMATRTVILKFSMSRAALITLELEYGFYTQQLVALQGNVIPKCFGLFKGTSGKMTLGCLILEHCEETPLSSSCSPEDIDDDKAEYVRKFMSGLCQIHKAGVMLNHKSDEIHSVYQGRDPRIIDFSRASTHVCRGACPAPLPYLRTPRSRNITCDGKMGCRELIAMEKESALVSEDFSEVDPLHGLSSFNKYLLLIGFTIKYDDSQSSSGSSSGEDS